MEDKLLKLISLSTTFGLIICSIHLFAYWSSFGINILEFVNLTDFIKLGIYPVVIGFASFVIGSLIGASLPPKKIDESKSQEEQKKQIANDVKFYKYLRLLMILFLAVVTILEYIKSTSGFWHFLGLLISFLLVFFIDDIKYLEPIIPNKNARSVITAIIISAFPFSFTTGKSNAQDVLLGKSVKIIQTKTIKDYGSEAFTKKGLLDVQDTLKFIGAAGDYFFFITIDNSATYAIQYSELHFLELKPYNTPPSN